MVGHICLLKLADSANKEKECMLMIKELGSLIHQISCIKKMNVDMELSRQSGFDIVIDITFQTMADVKIYQVHPAHQKIQEKYDSIVKERLAVDFYREEE